MRNCIVASGVAGVAMHLVNWLVAMVPGEFFASNFSADLTAWQVWVGYIFMGGVLATVFGWKGVGDPMAGAKAGATVGVLMGLGSAFGGMDGFDVMALVGAIVAGAVVWGIAGAMVPMATSGAGSDA